MMAPCSNKVAPRYNKVAPRSNMVARCSNMEAPRCNAEDFASFSGLINKFIFINLNSYFK